MKTIHYIIPLLLLSSTLLNAQVSSTNGNFTATTPSNLSLQTGATPTTRFTILQSNGNVGINTTSPADWLHVNGNVRATQLNVTGGTLNTIGATTNMNFNINGTNRMTLLSGGNLGIGTATPARLLTVMSSTPVISIQSASGSDHLTRALRFANSTDGYLAGIEVNGTSGEIKSFATTSFFPTYYSNGFEAMRINTAGNVGIGTTSPGGKLHVNGSIYVGNNDGSAPYRVSIGGSYGDYGSVGYGYKYTDLGGHTYIATEWASQLQFNAGGFDFKGATLGTAGANVNFSSLMKIINNGNVGIGIGTATPDARLDVRSPDVPLNHGAQKPQLALYTTSTSQVPGEGGLIVLGTYLAGLGRPYTQGAIKGIHESGTNKGALLFATTNDASTIVEHVRITGDGNVGIGTNAPAYKLDVAGTINATNILVNGQSLTSAASQWLNGTGNISYAAGNVGIGTNSPITPLQVNGTITANNLTGSPAGTFNVMSAVGQNLALIAQEGGNMAFATNSVTRATINGDGYLGIGISNPSQIFHVHQATYAGMRATTNVTGSTINDGVHFGYDDSYGAYVWNRENSPIIFSTNNAEQVRVAANGNMGIGTTSPAYKLDVAGTINATSILVNGQSLTSAASQWASGTGNISYTAGNVGIGTASPDAKLAVKGTIHTNEVKVDLNGAVAPDYVFEKDYNLMSLEETKAYIDANKHLPEVPSAKEMEKNGVQLGEMNLLLLKKVEELTLHLIEQNKKLDAQQQEIDELKNQIKRK